MTRSRNYLFVLAVTAALSFVILSFAALAHSIDNHQDDKATIDAAEKYLTGTWRGRWEEALRPKFTAEADSSPIWLQFKVERGKLTGVAIHDFISLDDGQNPDVKKLVLNKQETSPLFDLRFANKRLLFNENLNGMVIESQLEIIDDKKATLKIKQDGQFMPWLTLTRE